MFKFDTDRKVLEASVFDLDKDIKFRESYAYLEYQRFLKEDLSSSMVKVFEEFKYKLSIGKSYSDISLYKYLESLSLVDAILVNEEVGLVELRFKDTVFLSNKKYTAVQELILPTMRSDGEVEVNNRSMGFVNLLANKAGLYYSHEGKNLRDNTKKKLIFIYDNSSRFTVGVNESEDMPTMKVEMGKKKVDIVDYGANMLFDKDNKEEAYRMFRDNRLDVNSLSQDEVNVIVAHGRDKFSSLRDFKELENRHQTDVRRVITEEGRQQINETLSYRRALEQTTYSNIVNEMGDVIIKAHTFITEKEVDILNKHKVPYIHVVNHPKCIGKYLADTASLTHIFPGTRVTRELEESFPELKGLMYVPNLIDAVKVLGRPFFVEVGTEVTQELMYMLEKARVPEIIVATKPYRGKNYTRKEKKVHYFYRDIVHNGQFLDDGGRLKYYEFYREVDVNKQKLTAMDMLAAASLMCHTVNTNDVSLLEDVDISYCKRFETLGEKYLQALRDILPQHFRQRSNKISSAFRTTGSVTGLLEGDILSHIFLGVGQATINRLVNEFKCLKDIDYMNPLSYISSIREVGKFIKDKHSITPKLRYIDMYQINRTCPYETPAASNAGMVLHLAQGAVVERNEVKCKYYKVEWNENGGVIDKSKVHVLSKRDEDNNVITTIDTLPLRDMGGIYTIDKMDMETTCLARIRSMDPTNAEKFDLANIPVKYVNYVTCSPTAGLSVVVACMPFVASNDATRVSFNCSMLKQARALVYTEAPLVYTDAARTCFRYTEKFARFSSKDGEVSAVTDTIISLEYDDGTREDFLYKDQEYKRESFISRKPAKGIFEGARVKAGDVLITTNYDDEGVLAIGANMLVAYQPVGSNYEDGVAASNRSKRKLSSYRINKVIYEVKDIRNVDATPDIDYFKHAKKNDTFAGIGSKKKNSKSNKSSRLPIKADHTLGFPLYYKRDIEETFGGKKKYVFKFHGVTANRIEGGDKEANRHGNKGVAGDTVSNYKMAMLGNGEFVDIIYNPLGVISRMNGGQIEESHTGLAAKVLQINVMTSAFSGITNKEIEVLLSYAYDMANSTDESEMAKAFSDHSEYIPVEMHQHVTKNIGKVRYWANTFTKRGTAILFNPETGEPYDGEIVIGFQYISKLQQDSDKKLHHRAYYLGSRYKGSGAPTRGAANGGGQTIGNMEYSAQLAYGSMNFLHELTNERGDNPIARSNYTVEMLHRGKKMMLSEKYAMRASTIKFIKYMEGLGVKIDIDGLGDLSRATSSDLMYYSTKAISNAIDEEILELGDLVESEAEEDEISSEDVLKLLLGDQIKI